MQRWVMWGIISGAIGLLLLVAAVPRDLVSTRLVTTRKIVAPGGPYIIPRAVAPKLQLITICQDTWFARTKCQLVGGGVTTGNSTKIVIPHNIGSGSHLVKVTQEVPNVNQSLNQLQGKAFVNVVGQAPERGASQVMVLYRGPIFVSKEAAQQPPSAPATGPDTGSNTTGSGVDTNVPSAPRTTTPPPTVPPTPPPTGTPAASPFTSPGF